MVSSIINSGANSETGLFGYSNHNDIRGLAADFCNKKFVIEEIANGIKQGSKNSIVSTFCVDCGAKLVGKFCHSCGAKGV